MADHFEYLEAFDVIAQLPPTFYKNEGGVNSKKWQERKDALEALLKLISDNPKLDPKANYGELISTLNKLLGKDANINVSAVAAKCLAGIAYGLRAKFGPYASTVLPTLIDKLKEKKPMLREPVVECLDKIAATTSLDSLQDALIGGLENKNPQIRVQTAAFLYRLFKKYSDKTGKATLKAVAPMLVKNTADADVEVRSASLEALGSMLRATGPGGNGLVKDIADDKTRMEKVQAALEQAKAEVAKEQPPPLHAVASVENVENKESTSASAAMVGADAAVEADPFDFLDPFDVVSKLPATFYSEEGGVMSKKWQERKEALEALLKLMTDNPKLDINANYGELIGMLKKLLGKDANINVSAVAAKCLAGIAYGLRAKFGPHASKVLPTLIDKLKEKKSMLREPVVECLDKIAVTTSLDSLQDALVDGLENKNPQIRAQTAAFLYRAFKRYSDKTGKATLKAVVPILVKNTADADVEVRSASLEALGSMLRATGPGGNGLVKDIADDKTRMEKIQAALEQVKAEVAKEKPQPLWVHLTAPAARKNVEDKKPTTTTAAPARKVLKPDKKKILEPIGPHIAPVRVRRLLFKEVNLAGSKMPRFRPSTA